MTATITERLARTLHRLSEQAWVDPLTANFWLEQIDPVLSVNEVKARVKEVKKENDFLRLTLQPNLLWGGFKSGQHILLSVDINGRRHTRSYSICNPSQQQELIELGIRTQGVVSNYLLNNVRVGDVLSISQAQGEFVLPETLPEKMLFIAGGSGITPVISMIKTALLKQPELDIALIFYAQDYNRLPMGVEIQSLAFEHTNFNLKFSMTQTEPYDSDLSGHFCSDHLQWIKDWNERETWVCGPDALLKSTRTHWKMKADENKLHQERFRLVVESAKNPNTSFQLKLEKKQRSVTIDGNNTLLTLAENAGLNPKSGCRMGICHECRCNKSEGVTRNLLTNEVSSEPGTIQLCVTRAESDLTLDL